MNAQDLTLPEQLVLLGLEDRKGTLASPTSTTRSLAPCSRSSTCEDV